MRDMHCHILPGVDDGSDSLEMSLSMLEAAKAAGVTSMVCTPHCRDPFFDFEGMWEAFRRFQAAADGFPVVMGFEVNHAKLVDLGVEQWGPYLGFDGTGEFLLELSSICTEADFVEYEQTISTLQGMGYDVIIAHPERYRAIQKDIGLAFRLMEMGCKLQASADFVVGGRFGMELEPALKMFDNGMYEYIASDAHIPKHYSYLAFAVDEFPIRGDRARY